MSIVEILQDEIRETSKRLATANAALKAAKEAEKPTSKVPNTEGLEKSKKADKATVPTV